MNKFYFLTLFCLSLCLTACNRTRGVVSPNNIASNKEDHCIGDDFSQGLDDNLYGIDCIEGKKLLIKTNKTGPLYSISHSVNRDGNGGLRLEDSIDFIKKVYTPKYTVLKDQGDDKDYPFLRNFLSGNEEFKGSLNTKYHIVFQIEGNYLVLFKASTDRNDLPHTERTSAVQSKDGRLYMVPFLGYSIKYCNPEFIKNNQGEDTYKNRPNCSIDHLQNAKYIYITNGVKRPEPYIYLPKKDLFPASYFFGDKDKKDKNRWFYNLTPIDYPSSVGHEQLLGLQANYVELHKTTSSLDIVDTSGKTNIGDKDKNLLFSLPVEWKDYKMARSGSSGANFKSFAEEENGNKVAINKPYLTINFPSFESEHKLLKGVEIVDFLVSKNYFSFVMETKNKMKFKFSLLKETAVDTNNFIPKKWFKYDQEHLFGVLPISPQRINGVETGDEEKRQYMRMIRFNTNLNTDKEKRENTKIIKWYFSKQSTQSKFYRDIARESIEIWNRAFEFITKDTDKKIKVELAEREGDKDLGDLRYNIINLNDDTPRISSDGGILMGIAPSFAHSNTGQIIGTTSNIIISNIVKVYNKNIKNYIRYEVFQKHKKTDQEIRTHVVPLHLREKIEDQCPEVSKLINTVKQIKDLKPRDSLNDSNISLNCSKKISRGAILANLLHEMGHSFGLAHNFKASTDEDNYYHTFAEIQTIFPSEKQAISGTKPILIKTSSIMDYAHRDAPHLNILGKYDLAVLRYLYRDQVETKEGGLLPLNTPEDPDMQKPLQNQKTVLDQMKPYAYCFDTVSRKLDFLCIKGDFGSTPMEIVNFYIETFKRRLNSERYRYDYDIKESMLSLGSLLPPYLKALTFYSKWIEERDKYLNSKNLMSVTKYVFGDQEAIDEYSRLIKEGLGISKEYDAYYPVRNVIPKFVRDTLFIDTMKCEAEHQITKKTLFVNLESIKTDLLREHEDNLYVEDCYSEQVKSFLAKNNLQLIGQTGLENFNSYYSQGIKTNTIPDVYPFAMLQMYLFGQPAAQPQEQNSQKTQVLKFTMRKQTIENLTNEPNFFEIFRKRLENLWLNKGTGKSEMDFIKLSLYNGLLKFKLKNTTSEDSIERDIITENIEQLSSVIFAMGTDQNSFHKRVQVPLDGDIDIEETHIPFLIESYRNYIKLKDHNPNKSFEQYLAEKKEIISHRGELKYFIIPFKKGHLAEKMIKKYNENLNKIQKFNEKEMKSFELAFLDQQEREELKWHNKYLRANILEFAK